MLKAASAAAIFLACGSRLSAEAPIGKVVDSYIQGTSTYMLLEVSRLLNTGQTVYLHGGIPIFVREIVSIRETEGVYYYRTSAPEKIRVISGENVFLEVVKKEEKLRRFEQEAIFMKKKYGQITLVEGDKVIINRGSLHNVDKRDVYLIRTQEEKTKGKVELYGVGDFISVGRVYRGIEDQKSFNGIIVGDSVEFIGNRKILGIGLLLPTVHYNNTGGLQGGGNLWTVFLKRGWSCELLLGQFEREILPSRIQQIRSQFIWPMWLKKNFLYPGIISPFLGGGISLKNRYEAVTRERVVFSKEKIFQPMATLGIEFFSGHLFHLRTEVHYYRLPDFIYQGVRYKTTRPFYVAGATVNW